MNARLAEVFSGLTQKDWISPGSIPGRKPLGFGFGCRQ